MPRLLNEKVNNKVYRLTVMNVAVNREAEKLNRVHLIMRTDGSAQLYNYCIEEIVRAIWLITYRGERKPHFYRFSCISRKTQNTKRKPQ